MITVNQLMLHIICSLPERQGRKLAPKLKRVVAAGIIEENGCWIRRAQRGKATRGMIKQFLDRTGCECQLNDICIGDYLSKGTRHDFVTLQEQGFLLVQAFQKLLEPRGVFKIVLGFSRSDLEDDPNGSSNFMCGNLSFHKVRPKDVPYTITDLNTYLYDAMFVFTTDKKPNPGIVSERTWPTIPFRRDEFEKQKARKR